MFENFYIYIPKNKNNGTLLEENYNKELFPENILPFEKGIKILKKENRGLYLPLEMENEQNLNYFRSLGIQGF